MTKRTLRILVIIAIINLPLSCIEDDCGGFTPLEARISELTSTVGAYEASGFSNSAATGFNRAAINILINNMEYSEISRSNKGIYSIMNSAYACSPPEPEPTQAINSIKITSESNFYSGSQEYLSGENLVDLFKVTGFSYSINETTVNEFIQQQNDDLWIFGYAGANAVFQLLNKPDSSVNQKLKFKFEFSDLESIEVETTAFVVSNQ